MNTLRLETRTLARTRAARFTRVYCSALGLAWLASAWPAAADAGAQRPDGSLWDRPYAGELTFGIGAPTGTMGVNGELRVVSPLAFRLGVGITLPGDLQGAAMVRLRLPQLPALNLGAGVSAGSYGVVCLMCVRTQHPFWDRAVWNNYELSVETRFRTGGFLRAFAGAAVLLNRDDYRCDSGCDEDDVRDISAVLPYLGVGVGAVLDR